MARWDQPRIVRLAIVWSLLAGTTVAAETPTWQRFETTGVEMAVPIRLLFYAQDPEIANRASQAAMAEFRRLNGIFSDYDRASESRKLCAEARPGVATPVSDDLFRLLVTARDMARQSDGAFDVTVGPLTPLWRRSLRRGTLPPPKKLAEARQRVGWRFLRLDCRQKSVTLLKPDMRLDFGGIAKGYALDAALDVLRRHGITRALIDAGGDLRFGDPPPGKTGWRIGIAGVDDSGPPTRLLLLTNAAVASSGDARQYVQIGSKRYSHIVDPRTGIALTDHGIVTIIAPNATLADALASAVSVLGPTEGIRLVECQKRTAAFIERVPDGHHETHESSRFKSFLAPKKPILGSPR